MMLKNEMLIEFWLTIQANYTNINCCLQLHTWPDLDLGARATSGLLAPRTQKLRYMANDQIYASKSICCM